MASNVRESGETSLAGSSADVPTEVGQEWSEEN